MHPHLIHPVNVVISQRNVAAPGSMLNDAREPVKQAARSASVTLMCQVQWGKRADPVPHEGGPREESNGYIIVLRKDLTAAGVTLRRGDRITSVGGVATDLYLDANEPCMHYHGSPQGEMWQFQDRQPTRR